METDILPLAVTMMAGPQIMSAVIFVTTEKPVPTSMAFLVGVAIATAVGVALAVWVAGLLGNATSLGAPDSRGSTGNLIQFVLVGLLILGAVKNWRGRETAEPPPWLGKLVSADWKRALKTGILVIVLMPSDILVMLTVGVNLEHRGGSFVDALPFIETTILIAALPILGYILFRRRAARAMPGVRDWMNTRSWLVKHHRLRHLHPAHCLSRGCCRVNHPGEVEPGVGSSVLTMH
ncbi:MAG: GAP family protein [Actinomycetota bacterium]